MINSNFHYNFDPYSHFDNLKIPKSISNLNPEQQAKQLMETAEIDSNNLYKKYKLCPLDQSFVESFTSILKNVEEANRFVPAQRKIWEELGGSWNGYYKSRETDAEYRLKLVKPILEHRSCLNKMFAYSFFDTLVGDARASSQQYQENNWQNYVFASVLTSKGAAKILEIKLKDYNSETPIYSGSIKNLKQIIIDIDSKKLIAMQS